MPATPSATAYKHIYALYDSADGKTYRTKIRQDLGTQTGLAADGASTGGALAKNHKYCRRAHFKGDGANSDVKRTYLCSKDFFDAHVGTAATITMDGITLVLTGMSGEDIHG